MSSSVSKRQRLDSVQQSPATAPVVSAARDAVVSTSLPAVFVWRQRLASAGPRITAWSKRLEGHVLFVKVGEA